MRPTLLQIYNDPYTIIEALEGAGLENAREKVMGIFNQLIEYWSMSSYIDRINRDRTYAHQSEARRQRLYRTPFDAEQRRREKKQVSEYNRIIIVGRGSLRRRARVLEGKVAKWPELNLDPTTLRKKPDAKLVKAILKKRRRTSRKSRYIL